MCFQHLSLTHRLMQRLQEARERLQRQEAARLAELKVIIPSKANTGYADVLLMNISLNRRSLRLSRRRRASG